MKKKLVVVMLLCMSSSPAWGFWQSIQNWWYGTNANNAQSQEAQHIIKTQQAPVEVSHDALLNENQENQQSLSQALQQFKANHDFGELLVQKVINLLDSELSLVNLLICGRHGQAVEEAITCRNQQLERTTPSVAYLYDKIMDIVTFNDELCDKLQRKAGKKCARTKARALNLCDRREFLYSMQEQLMRYINVMYALQCDVSIAAARPSDVPIDIHDNVMAYCPLVK